MSIGAQLLERLKIVRGSAGLFFFPNKRERSLAGSPADAHRARNVTPNQTHASIRQLEVDAHPPMNGNSVPFPSMRPRTERTKKRATRAACTQQIDYSRTLIERMHVARKPKPTI
jgi:hypothetical protein